MLNKFFNDDILDNFNFFCLDSINSTSFNCVCVNIDVSSFYKRDNGFSVFLLMLFQVCYMLGSSKFDSCKVGTLYLPRSQNFIFHVFVRKVKVSVGVDEQFRNRGSQKIMITAKMSIKSTLNRIR